MWAFLAKAVEKVTFGAIKSGVETAKTVTDIQKNRLDIKLKQQELDEKERLVLPATFEQVREFDPKIKRIERAAKLLWTLVLWILLALMGFYMIHALIEK